MVGVAGQRVTSSTDPAQATTALRATDLEHFGEPDVALSGRPNDNYELREMVSVATTYLNQGMVDDAEDLLQEALDAGYDRADAIELFDRVRRARGVMEPAPAPSVAARPRTPLPLTAAHFTAPLPGVERLGAEVQRAVRLSDADLAAGRLHSALDASYAAVALAPSFFPLYIRIAEIVLALGDADGASDLVDAINVCVELRDQADEWMLLPIRVALNPEDDDALARYAVFLLEQTGALPLEPFVPNAIAKMLATQPERALSLADAYVQRAPRNVTALRLYARAALAAGQPAVITDAIIAHVDLQSPPDLLYLRAALAGRDGRAGWLKWLERAVASLAGRPESYEHVPAAIETAAAIVPSRLNALGAALVEYTARQFAAAGQSLEQWRAGRAAGPRVDAEESFLAAVARAVVLRDARHPDALEALRDAIAEGVIIDVRPFADSVAVFGFSVSPVALLAELVARAKELHTEQQASALLAQLRNRFPELLEVRSALADLLIATGAVADGIRELRSIAERYEQLGDVPNMVGAMRRIAAQLPTNAEVKAKLIDGYVQRGVLDEAMAELRLLGDLHTRRGKRAEAVAAYMRGAEVAATMGDLTAATNLYERAAAAQPEDDAIRHAAVAFYLQTGAVEPAARHLWEVVRIATRAQDPDEAVAALHQIIALTPSDPGAYHKLGEVLSSMGEYAQAERVYRRLGQMAPDDPVLAAKQSALAALAAQG